MNKGIIDAKYHRWLLDAFDERLRGDYDIYAEIDTSAVSKRIVQAEELIATVRAILLKESKE